MEGLGSGGGASGPRGEWVGRYGKVRNWTALLSVPL